jgi:N-acetylneuraminate synthase
MTRCPAFPTIHGPDGSQPPCFIIAEAGVNHNGSVDLACELIEAALTAKASAVKFQTFTTEDIVRRDAPQAPYQAQNTGLTESQFAMIKRLELSGDLFRRVRDHAHRRGIEFLSTPFDEASLALLLEPPSVPRLKIPSGEITNAPFLLSIARTGLPIILSTGMSTLGEVEDALGVLAWGILHPRGLPRPAEPARAFADPAGRRMLHERVTLLHCTTEYPAAFTDVNLRALDTLSAAYELPVGLSDHSPGIVVPLAAVARGAVVIEKHLTLDRTLPGPDHQASLEPAEFAAMVEGIRTVEAALGDGQKRPRPGELPNRAVARKGLVARRAIAAGEPFTLDNVTAKRPASGLPPTRIWELLGKPAPQVFGPDDEVFLEPPMNADTRS